MGSGKIFEEFATWRLLYMRGECEYNYIGIENQLGSLLIFLIIVLLKPSFPAYCLHSDWKIRCINALIYFLVETSITLVDIYM